MLSPEFKRELIRLANRDRQDHEGVIDLFMTGEMVYAQVRGSDRDLVTPNVVFDTWKDSFDGDFEP